MRDWWAELIVAALTLAIVVLASLDAMPTLWVYAVEMPGWTAGLEAYGAAPQAWDWRHATGITLISWLFWSMPGIALVSLAKRRFAPALALLLVFLGTGYYLGFRTTCFEAFAGTVCLDRSWGPITRSTVESTEQKFETWWRWHPPYVGTHSGEEIRSRSDRNGDGLWDTWSDYSTGTLQIDVDADQVPDHDLRLDFAGWEQSRALRGY